MLSFYINPFYHASSRHPVFERPSFLILSLLFHLSLLKIEAV